MDLYALPPEEFTAARDAAAKEDKALKGLRRPTVAAWVVNTLVRREAGLLQDLLALGRDLAEAQSGRDADALRELGQQRKQLVAAVTQRAVEVSGRDVTPAVRLEVEQTLEAALADPASADAVLTGQLTRALQYAGFGGVDLEGAVAPVPVRPAAEAPKQGKLVAKLEAAALEAQGALDDAVRKAEVVARQLEQTEQALVEAREASDAAHAAVEQAQRALEQAQERAAAAVSRRTEAKRAHEEAERKAQRTTEAVAKAQAAAEQARAKLDAARRG